MKRASRIHLRGFGSMPKEKARRIQARGGYARALSMSPEQRAEIARNASRVSTHFNRGAPPCALHPTLTRHAQASAPLRA